MDTSMIDQQYTQLQNEFNDVAQSVQGLAAKMQAAQQAGDDNAKEWLLDLKQIALDIKDEQMQVNALLQEIHSFVQNAAQQMPVQQMPVQQMPAQGAAPAMGGGGMFGNFLHGGFGQAMMLGAGVGLGDDLINSIF
jgi:uncharacterized phage infection (PIP) family protein YhgE